MKALIAAALICTPIAASAADGGLYLGAGLGQGRIQDNSRSFDSKETAYKGFVGYRLGALPIIDLAAEVGYTDFGHRVEHKLRGATAALPLGPLDLIGKAGAVRWSYEASAGGASSSRSGTNALVGAGIGFRIWKLGVRAEYEYYDIKSVDRAEMLSVSAILQF
jgi:hypothetical protein